MRQEKKGEPTKKVIRKIFPAKLLQHKFLFYYFAIHETRVREIIFPASGSRGASRITQSRLVLFCFFLMPLLTDIYVTFAVAPWF